MTTFTVCSHNVNGFHRSKDFLKGKCDENENLIYALQETWLKPPYKNHLGVNELRHLHPDYEGYGVSAMTSDKTIRKGRPYGGTGFLFPKRFTLSIKPCPLFKNERVSVVMLKTDVRDILCINVYFPYFCSAKLAEQEVLYKDTIAHVEGVMSENRNCAFILMADVNCNYYDLNHPFTKLLRDMLSRWNMISCFDLGSHSDKSKLWTRHEFKKDKNSPNGFIENRSFIDGMFLSRSLISLVKDVRINYDGSNVSDHFPVEMDLFLSLDECNVKGEIKKPFLNWQKISPEDLKVYSNYMEMVLDSIVPSEFICHGNKICSCPNHIFEIERYYLQIVDAIAQADRLLPRCNPKFQRDFWSDELTDLKSESINSTNLWKDCGKPLHGPVFDYKIKSKLLYKRALRKSKLESRAKRESKMHDDLTSKNDISFWKSWRSFQGKLAPSPNIDGFINDGDIANHFASHYKKVFDGNDVNVESSLKEKFIHVFSPYEKEHSNDDISGYLLSFDELVTALRELKCGKSSSTSIFKN